MASQNRFIFSYALFLSFELARFDSNFYFSSNLEFGSQWRSRENSINYQYMEIDAYNNSPHDQCSAANFNYHYFSWMHFVNFHEQTRIDNQSAFVLLTSNKYESGRNEWIQHPGQMIKFNSFVQLCNIVCIYVDMPLLALSF